MEAQKKWIAAVLLAAVTAVGALVLASAGGASGGPSELHPRALSWVRPTVPPASWRSLPLPESPAVLPLPPGWHAAPGDPGTRTAELTGADGEVEGYLNATPRQGQETLGNWGEFRVEHNRDEGDREVELLAAAGSLEFRTGRGSCVIDSYLTTGGRRYREIACIVAGPEATTVIVGAAPPGRWSAEQGVLRRAVTSFTT